MLSDASHLASKVKADAGKSALSGESALDCTGRVYPLNIHSLERQRAAGVS